jgi:hypothetical protein
LSTLNVATFVLKYNERLTEFIEENRDEIKQKTENYFGSLSLRYSLFLKANLRKWLCAATSFHPFMLLFKDGESN